MDADLQLATAEEVTQLGVMRENISPDLLEKADTFVSHDFFLLRFLRGHSK
jgi:hypothetical protein